MERDVKGRRRDAQNSMSLLSRSTLRHSAAGGTKKDRAKEGRKERQTEREGGREGEREREKEREREREREKERKKRTQHESTIFRKQQKHMGAEGRKEGRSDQRHGALRERKIPWKGGRETIKEPLPSFHPSFFLFFHPSFFPAFLPSFLSFFLSFFVSLFVCLFVCLFLSFFLSSFIYFYFFFHQSSHHLMKKWAAMHRAGTQKASCKELVGGCRREKQEEEEEEMKNQTCRQQPNVEANTHSSFLSLSTRKTHRQGIKRMATCHPNKRSRKIVSVPNQFLSI